MIGAELLPPYAGNSNAINDLARQHGVLVLVAGPNVLRFVPPLTITTEEMHEGLTRFEKALAEYKQQAASAA